jgi:hypothetical protein
MPVLDPGVPRPSREPTLLVENRLEPGSWRFRLTAVDDAGNVSDPADLVVRVVRRGPPVPPIDDEPIRSRPGPPRPKRPVKRPRPRRPTP